jgi:hypothetical protein
MVAYNLGLYMYKLTIYMYGEVSHFFIQMGDPLAIWIKNGKNHPNNIFLLIPLGKIKNKNFCFNMLSYK